MKVLLDDSLTYQDGCQGITYIEYKDSTPEAGIETPEVLLLEFQLGPIKGILGYRLIEEKIRPDGSTEVMQEFNLAPDVAYALFKHWEELDKNA